MKYQFFTVFVNSSDSAQQELNHFCASHKVATVEKEFVADGDKSFWAFCVTYLDRNKETVLSSKSKIDYREVLNEKDFAVYAKLRDLRKTISKQEGVPAYALFTNEQLATMVKKQIVTSAGMNLIDGVGKSRMEKYGTAFLDILKQEIDLEGDSKVADET